MQRINIPTVSYSEQELSLGGEKYTLIFKFNRFDERWRIDMYKDDSLVLGGLKVMENASLIRFKYSPSEFLHGDIQCHRIFDDGLLVGRDNLGINKAYELIYFTNEELGL